MCTIYWNCENNWGACRQLVFTSQAIWRPRRKLSLQCFQYHPFLTLKSLPPQCGQGSCQAPPVCPSPGDSRENFNKGPKVEFSWSFIILFRLIISGNFWEFPYRKLKKKCSRDFLIILSCLKFFTLKKFLKEGKEFSHEVEFLIISIGRILKHDERRNKKFITVGGSLHCKAMQSAGVSPYSSSLLNCLPSVTDVVMLSTNTALLTILKSSDQSNIAQNV